MVEIRVQYEGGLRCRAVHGPSGAELVTDAPVDNHGKGASFSPTDLVATALATCVLTTMGIVAERHGWELAGSTALDARARETLEKTAHTCPVHKSLGADVELPMRFEYTLGSPG